MAKVRLGLGDVGVGKPLPYALMDEGGRVLLNIGYVIPSKNQLERLIDRGVFFEVFENEATQSRVSERVSVYRLVVAVADEYQALLSIPVGTATLQHLGHIAVEIAKLCALDADAALAFILLHKNARYSIRHAFAAAILTEVLMQEMKQPAAEVRRAVIAALSMNLCMLELQDELYRQELALVAEQKQAIVLHPQRAARKLADLGCTDTDLLGIIEDHHESINGSGYARRKKAPELGLSAQVVSLADRYCAVVSERAYRAATPPATAARELLSRQAATIDTMLSAYFIRVMGVYPPGAVVKLANGEVAVVTRRTLHPVQPVVRSLRSRNGVRYPDPPKRLTSKEGFTIAEAANPDHLKGVDLAALFPPIEEQDA